MCLIKETVVKGNLPKSILGYKGLSTACTGELIFPIYGGLATKGETQRSSPKQRTASDFKKCHGYQCGFHIAASKKAALGWADDADHVFYAVGWDLTAWGYQGLTINRRYTEKTYVARYMRIFDTLEEAKKFKKDLDARRKKK